MEKGRKERALIQREWMHSGRTEQTESTGRMERTGQAECTGRTRRTGRTGHKRFSWMQALLLLVLGCGLLWLAGCERISDAERERLLLNDERFRERSIAKVEQMPTLPQPYAMRDWNAVAREMDALLFDFNAQGEYLPLVWWDTGRRNVDQDIFALPSFVGDNRQSGEIHEGIVAIGAVLGATLAGVDKSDQDGQNYVRMLQNYYNKDNGIGIVMNATNAGNGSFWYDILPNILFYGVTAHYPNEPELETIMRASADRWHEALTVMKGDAAFPSYEYSYFDFKKMQPVDNGQWVEPDSSAGTAWLQYAAYAKWKEDKYLDGAKWGMDFLESLSEDQNPLYELLLPYGAYLGARMNAELGTAYDVDKMINWSFDGFTYARPAWGVVAERWGDYDVHGLQGSLTDGGGYVFAMNTFHMAGPIVPIARYDARYAKSIGKWMLNAANNARLFYPEALADEQQSNAGMKSAYNNLFAYEGLRKQWGLESPYAMGDARKYGWAKTDFGVYGSVLVGYFGGLVDVVDDGTILRLDLLKTDFFHEPAYPTWLYYNPHDEQRIIEIDVGSTPVDLYDAVSKQFVARQASGATALTLAADSAVVLVVCPAGGELESGDRTLSVDGVVIDYNRLRK